MPNDLNRRTGLRPQRANSLEPEISTSRDEGAQSARAPLRLGLLLSGRGSNFLAIAESIRTGKLPGVEIAVVVSNVAEAPGLAAARPMNLPHAVFVSKGRLRDEHDRDVAACLHAHHVDLVCLAGYMRLLSAEFVAAFPNRILNIHPSLLPAFPGLDAQQQAFDYGVKWAGCTVHFVDEHLDHGAIVLQRAIPVLENDNGHSLAERILREEHLAYTEAIARVASGLWEVRGRRYVLRESAPTA
ncbi:MAG: phosphoribosylglycinamide formyltransferase [Terracidiphilus sp.]